MLSRVADAIYWMNRYVERAENYARFIDVNFNLSLELPTNSIQQWEPLVVTTGDWDLYHESHEEVDKTTVINFLGFDPGNPNSICNCIINARENARAIRPELTKEVWEQINYLYYLVKDGLEKEHWQQTDPRDFFREIKTGCQLLYGIFDATISRNEGWHFGKIGQMIERADKTSRVLDVKYHMLLPTPEAVGSPVDLIQWAALLKSVSAYDMYRKHNGKLTPQKISNFLILDKEFPRSMLHCLIRAQKSLNVVSNNYLGIQNEAQKKLGMLCSQLEYSDIDDIFDSGLHEYLDSLQRKLNVISTAIFETFFSIDNIKNEHIQTNQ